MKSPHRFLVLLSGLLSITVGCQGPRAMKSEFIEYSHAYAETSNQQMLLNLARRANGHPAYFLQMGTINATMQFGATAGGSAGQNRTRASGGALATAAAISDTIAVGSTLGLSGSEQPSFSFTPLSGSSFAAALFNPIDPKIFFNLYDQGIPVDALLRVMVQSITLNEAKGSRTFLNVIDPERPVSYRNFLTVAGLARELQKRHLLLSSTNQNSFIFADKAYETVANLRTNVYYQYEEDSTYFVPNNSGTDKKRQDTINLTLRTFEGVLTALAQESELFDGFVRTDGTNFTTFVAPSERRPALRITPPKAAKTTSPVAEITYRGEKFSISDEIVIDPVTKQPKVNTWNREVFNLLNMLYVQISLDPSKLPVQQLIQVH